MAPAGGGTTVELRVQGRVNAYPSIASAGSLVAVAWGASASDGTTEIYAALSRDNGRAFARAVRVSDRSSPARLAGEQPPRIVLVPQTSREPSIVVVWTGKADAGTRLLSARSDDGGRTFSAAALVPGSDAAGNRGWESAAADGTGGVAALWLDHRELAQAAGAAHAHSEHHHAPLDTSVDGAIRAQSSKLLFARLGDTVSTRTITGGVCYCCKTTMAVDADGRIYAAWRHVFAGNIRDIAFTLSADRGRTFAPPVRVSEDRWVLEGCPENGPALAVDGQHRVHVVWPTLLPSSADSSEPTLALFYAMSSDHLVFTARQRIPTEGVPRHPWIARGSRDELIVVWDEGGSGTRRIALARGSIDAKGDVRFVRQPLGEAFSGTYPVVAASSDGATVAWTSGPAGQTVIRVAKIPKD